MFFWGFWGFLMTGFRGKSIIFRNVPFEWLKFVWISWRDVLFSQFDAACILSITSKLDPQPDRSEASLWWIVHGSLAVPRSEWRDLQEAAGNDEEGAAKSSRCDTGVLLMAYKLTMLDFRPTSDVTNFRIVQHLSPQVISVEARLLWENAPTSDFKTKMR